MVDKNPLPRSVLDELARIRQLPSTGEGPIADTYERLQGIEFLRAAAPSEPNQTFQSRIATGLAQCRELALFNIAALLNRTLLASTAKRPFDIDTTSHDLRWALSIAALAVRFTHSIQCISETEPGDFTSNSVTPAGQELLESYRAFDQLLHTDSTKHADECRTAIERMYLLNGRAVVIHSVKNLGHLIREILVAPVWAPPVDALNSSILKKAVEALDTRTQTYLMQFRLLHQIPEVLSLQIAPLFDAIGSELKEKSFERASLHLRLASLALAHVVEALPPLIDLMYPSEYYRIRQHLGKTSGSQSRDLGAAVLVKAYKGLAESFVAARGDAASLAPNVRWMLEFEMHHIHHHVARWRTLHLMLPRNLLGQDAISLIGSRAIPEVSRRRDQFIQSDPLVAGALRQVETSQSGTDEIPGARGESALVALTGEITGRKFPDVQNRTGRYAKRAE